MTSRIFADMIRGRKILKKIGLKGRQIIKVPREPHVSGQPWI